TTGTGDFRTGRRFSGWETSPLGRLYNPIYFNGGIAFHGALSVPKRPASHGCVRMPMHIAEYFPDLLGTGVPVHARRPREELAVPACSTAAVPADLRDTTHIRRR